MIFICCLLFLSVLEFENVLKTELGFFENEKY